MRRLVEPKNYRHPRLFPGYPDALPLVKGDTNNVSLAIAGHDRGPNTDTERQTPPILRRRRPGRLDGWRQVEFSLPWDLSTVEKRRETLSIIRSGRHHRVNRQPDRPGTLAWMSSRPDGTALSEMLDVSSTCGSRRGSPSWR